MDVRATASARSNIASPRPSSLLIHSDSISGVGLGMCARRRTGARGRGAGNSLAGPVRSSALSAERGTVLPGSPILSGLWAVESLTPCASRPPRLTTLPSVWRPDPRPSARPPACPTVAACLLLHRLLLSLPASLALKPCSYVLLPLQSADFVASPPLSSLPKPKPPPELERPRRRRSGRRAR